MMAITLVARHVPSSFASSDVHDERKCKYTGQSVRAIPMRVITVGKKRDRGIQLIVDEYTEKIRHYCTMDDVLIRSNPKNARDVKAQIEHEDIAVTNLIRSDDWVVILDERGKDVSSEQLADLIGDAGITGASRLLFCVGGPYGHGRQLRQRANLSIKLSSLVLNHQIALVVLMEQLYRVWTILKDSREVRKMKSAAEKEAIINHGSISTTLDRASSERNHEIVVSG